MRELSKRVKYIYEDQKEEREFTARIHGLELKKENKPMQHDDNLDDAVQRKINGRINLRNRDKSKSK